MKFTFLSENMKKLHTDGMSVRKEKRSLCVVLKKLFLFCSANCTFPSSLQETVPPPKKIITLKSQIEIFFS